MKGSRVRVTHIHDRIGTFRCDHPLVIAIASAIVPTTVKAMRPLNEARRTAVRGGSTDKLVGRRTISRRAGPLVGAVIWHIGDIMELGVRTTLWTDQVGYVAHL